MKAALVKAGAVPHVLGPHLGTLKGAAGSNGTGAVPVDHTIVTMPSVVYDALYIPGGRASVDKLMADGGAVHFVAEAFKHAKAIAASAEGSDLLKAAGVAAGAAGVLQGAEANKALMDSFIAAVAAHRAWDRSGLMAIPA